jgi:hypothetical protein
MYFVPLSLLLVLTLHKTFEHSYQVLLIPKIIFDGNRVFWCWFEYDMLSDLVC